MGFPGDNELTLNKEMKTTWLIQRLQKPQQFDNPFSFGGGLKNGGLSDNAMGLIRGIFSFDYMESAEFEYGAVPQALRFIAEQSANHNLIAGKIETNPAETIYYLSPTEYEAEVIKRIKILRAGEMQLKERSGLDAHFDSPQEYAKQNCGWLELDNGFMFFADQDMFNTTCKLFGIQQKVGGEAPHH